VYQGAPAPEGSFASMARCLLQRLPDASRARSISTQLVGASLQRRDQLNMLSVLKRCRAASSIGCWLKMQL
jgi:hypothetical protein